MRSMGVQCGGGGGGGSIVGMGMNAFHSQKFKIELKEGSSSLGGNANLDQAGHQVGILHVNAAPPEAKVKRMSHFKSNTTKAASIYMHTIIC
jgi:hypothetical protein